MRKSIWKKEKFWIPIVTGLVTSGAFAVKFVFDFDIPEAVVAWLIAAGMFLISIIVGVEWGQLDEKQDK